MLEKEKEISKPNTTRKANELPLESHVVDNRMPEDEKRFYKTNVSKKPKKLQDIDEKIN